MLKKSTFLNAGPITLLFRLVVGYLLSGLFWFALGWAFLSIEGAIALSAWVLTVGPLLLALSYRVFLMPTYRRLDWAKEESLAELYLRELVARPGPRPRLSIRPSTDISFLWFESLFSFRGRQEIVVTTAWMQLDSATRRKDFGELWRVISEYSPFQKKLRSVLMILWIGAVSPLAFLAWLAKRVQYFLKLEDFPLFSTWLQRVLWSLKGLWMGSESREPMIEFIERANKNRTTFKAARGWDSILWGVWFLVPERYMHPLWPLLFSPDAFLLSSESARPLQEIKT